VTAPEQEAEPGVARGFRIVDRDRIVGRHVVDEAEDALGPAVGHIVDEHAAAPPRLGRAQDEEIRRVFDEAGGIARRLVEIADAGVLGRLRVEHTLRHAADADIRAGLAIGLIVGKGLDGADRDPGDRHGAAPLLGGWIGVVRPSRRLPRSFLRIRFFHKPTSS
jgi:hypothetical protein